MTKKQRFAAGMLALLLCVSLLPAAALADGETAYADTFEMNPEPASGTNPDEPDTESASVPVEAPSPAEPEAQAPAQPEEASDPEPDEPSFPAVEEPSPAEPDAAAATGEPTAPEVPDADEPTSAAPSEEPAEPAADAPVLDSAPPGSSSSVVYGGATEITSSATRSNETYTSTKADQSALYIYTSGTVTINNPTVTKSGSSSGGDNCNFYGQNAAVLCRGGGTTYINGGTITSSASGANGVFSYGGNGGQNGRAGDGTTVYIENTKITTTGSGSGGIMTTGGGITYAKNLTITTSGGSSAPIRTDRGGGTVVVDGGTYTANGLGSPVIYSTAAITVRNATLVSNQSEGVCIEGKNSITLENCTFTVSNTRRNGNAKFLDSIMIYQSFSGDASSGTSSFSMTGGSLVSNSGHVFHVTNTNAVINLSGTAITNNDSADILISVCDDGWSGASNIATLNASSQTLEGGVLVGSDSKLTMNLTGGSTLTGYVSGNITNAAGTKVSSSVGTVAVSLDSTSRWVLTEDSYITSFSGDPANVISKGHTLYVNGVPLQGTSDGRCDDGHTLNFVEGKAASCTEDGYEGYYECFYCGKLFADAEAADEIGEPVVIAAKGHALSGTAAVSASCTEDGNIAFYTCADCGRLFSDAAGKTEIGPDDTVIPALGHTPGSNPVTVVREPSCTEDGEQTYLCARCGEDVTEAIPATGHDWDEGTVLSEPTHTKAGRIRYTCKTDPSHTQEDEIPVLEPYTYLEGDGSTWTIGSSSDLSFRVSGPYDLFLRVEVDGKVLDAANYTSASGSTIIRLKAGYLKTLSAGSHTLKTVYKDGDGEYGVSASFTVNAASSGGASSRKSSPHTADGNDPLLWLCVFTLCGAGAAAVTAKKRYKGR